MAILQKLSLLFCWLKPQGKDYSGNQPHNHEESNNYAVPWVENEWSKLCPENLLDRILMLLEFGIDACDKNLLCWRRVCCGYVTVFDANSAGFPNARDVAAAERWSLPAVVVP